MEFSTGIELSVAALRVIRPTSSLAYRRSPVAKRAVAEQTACRDRYAPSAAAATATQPGAEVMSACS